ncbi:hypothetical protein D4Z05_24405 [Salmonella enterica subsp. enterica serovar Enteritidis]|nr:hypothetical protein [Salmonella enterica subsp. enterica serovar Enteritidis]
MNKIFKVIWSKSKQCYVVVSEMAKNTTGKKKIIVASILAGLAMSTMGPNVMAVSSIPFTDKPSSALGNGSVKPGTTNGVAIGNAAYSDSHQSIAIGFRSLASGTFLGGSIKPSVAVGAGAHAEGNNTVAIGTVAENRASYGVSLGNESKVTSGSDYGIAIGYQTQVSAVHSMAIGEKANASATLAIALGANAKATGAYSYTAGFNSESGGEAAIAVGKSASAGGESAVAVGNGTVATAGDAVAIGTSSQATGGDSIALGKNANASNGDSIAIGQDTVSNQINSVALGKSSQATGGSATALGPQAKATGSTAVAIGLNSEANTSATVAIGQSSAASGLQAIAVGYKSAASGENAAAYGNTAKAVGKNSLALGANTQATVEGGVALGAGSIANTVAGAGYNPNTGRTDTFTGLSGNALTSTWAAVSIGDGTNTRQLTGLAAGTNNTDAVNVAQLKSMNLAFTADGSTKGDVNLTNSALNVVGDSTYITTKGNNQTLTISGKKQNITVTNGTASASAGMADANNVAQAINQANADQTISYKANGGTANTVKVSDGLNFTNGASTVATVGVNGQVTYDLNTTTKQSITDSSTAVNRTISLGGSTGSTTAKKLASGDVKFNIKGQTGTSALITTSATGDDVTIAPTSKLTDAVTAAENAANKDLSNLSTAGNTNIKNLAKTAAAWNVSTNGSGTTTVSGGDTVNFVNGDNIAVTNTGRTITIGTAKNVSFDKVTVGGVVLDKTDGINAGNKEIKGIATGTTATSAVNKQQMDDAVKAASDATTALGKNTIALGSDSGSTTAKKLNTSAITFNIKGDTGANALITTTATGDNVSITPTAKLTNAVAAAENAANKNLSNISSSGETVIKNLAKGAAQDAVKVAGTGLATVSDNTVGGVKTYTVDVNTGNLVVAANGQVGAAGTTGASGAAGSNGVATTQNVATAINDAVTKAKASATQALADAEHKFAGDTGTTSVRKHGEVLSIKGGVTNTASLTTGNIGVVSDGAGTLNVQLVKVLSGLTSATFTTAGGNTTVINSDGVTITPSVAGASAISMTTAGINAGNKEIKGVATGTTADAAVNKAQMDAAITAAAGGSLSTEKVVAKTLSGDNNLATVTGQTGTAKGETYEVAVSENAVKNVAKAAAQDAVTVTGTGLATVSDNTTGGVKTYTVDVNTGNLVVAANGQVGAAGATGASGAAGSNGVATTQNVATAINDAVTKANANNAQALADAKHNFAGDDATVISRKHGEQLNIKGGASTTATDLTSGNIAVVGDTTTGTLNIKMAKALTGLTSATFTDGSGNTQTVTGGSSTITDGAGHTTAMTKGGLSTTDGTNTTTVAPAGITATDGTNTVKLNGSGIDAGNTQIKNVGKATTDDAAVNKKQMDDAVKSATDATTALGNNTIALGGDTGSTTAKKLSTNAITFNIKGDTGANALITTSATGDNVTIAPTAKLTAAVTAAENSADKDLSNISSAGKTVIKDLAATSAQDAVNVTGTGLATVSDNTTGGVKTYTVNVDEGKLVLDDTTGQIGANGATQGTTAGKNGVATTQNVATAINDAVTKAKASTTQALADAEHKFDGDTGATSVRKHGEVLSIKGGVTTPADLSTGNIGVVSDGAGTLNIRLAKVLSGLTSATFTDGSGNTQTVTGASSTITDGAGNTTAMTKGGLSTTDGTNTTTVAPAGVTATDGTNTVKLNGSGIDAGNTQIKNVGKATTDDAAVNKKQMDDAVKSATDATTALGNNTIALGGDTGSTTAKKLSTNAITFNIKGDTGANALITTSATGDDVTIAPTAKLTAAVTAAENSADKDLSNISSAGKTVIKDLAVTSAQDAVNVTGTGLATVSDNTTGGVKTYTVDVKAGNLVVDANGQAGAAGATGTGGAVGTDGVATTQNVATAINDAITKSNANTAQALADAEHKFDGDTGSTSVRKHGEVLSIKGGVANAADLTTGNIGVVSDGAGTLNIRLAKVLNGLTSATFKDASGNTTMVTGGSTTIADTSGNTQTLAPTKSEIKDTNGVSTVTTKDGVTAKDASGQTTSLTKGGVDATDGNGNTTSLTNTGVSTTDGHGHTTGLTNGGLSTTDGTNTTTVAPTGITATDGTNTVKLNGSGIDAGNTEIKNVGKATTDDAAVNKKQMDDAITKATADATHEFGGDDATVVSRKHGEKLTIKGGASTNAADLTSGNIAVIGDTNGTLNLKLAKVLTGLTSATFTDGNGNTQTVTGGSSTISDAAGNSTVVSKGGVTTTDAAGNSTTTAPTGVTVTPAGGTQISITTDGINAGGKEVKGIANGTTNDAAVNKGQMDAAVQNALDGTQALGNNTITLGGDTGSTDAKKLNTSGGIQFNIKGESGANALIRTTASGNTVSIASTDKLNNAVAAAENAANKDLSNLSANGESWIKDLAKSAASWNVQTNGGATTAVSGGDTVNFVDGKNITITNTGRAITVATKDDVTFNKITVGGMTLDNNGMDAGNKEIKNVAAGTTANSAVNKQQLDNAISGVSNINYTTSSTTDRAGSTPVHSVSLSTGFNFKGDGNIQVTQDAANNGVIHFAMNPNLSGITSITGAGNGAPTMTFNSQNGNTPANVSINSNLDMGGHRITGVGPAEKPTDAVNKQQVDQALRGLTGMADNAARQYASKAGANAAALAALKPIQYDPLEPTQIMAGVGNYKSQTAVALGMAHYTNENTMFNIGVSLDSHDNMVNAGVTHKFGYSPEKKAIPDRYKGGPISSIYVMQDEMQALLAKDQEKDAVISKQASEIDTLRQQNEDMQRKIDMILAKLQ